ncbi:hypothetical protein HanIR_Chr05g0228291 [Helianthus annuus]|nr:hypothetical protein HanIR_Chr05g0228291 [Helianthus annuus]
MSLSITFNKCILLFSHTNNGNLTNKINKIAKSWGQLYPKIYHSLIRYSSSPPIRLD